MTSRINTSFAWYTAAALWIMSIPMVLRLVCFGIEGFTRCEALLFFPWMIPNVFLTLGLVTGYRHLLLPMVGLFLLMVVIFPLRTVYILYTVLLPNLFFYALSGLTGTEYKVACGACLWDVLGQVVSGLLVSVLSLVLFTYFYELLKSPEVKQVSLAIYNDDDDDDSCYNL